MKLDELRTVQSKERRKDSLQQLRDSFYEDVAAFIQDLKASRDRRADQVSDPFSDDEVRRMSDELETAEEVAEAIYERRVGKVVKLASFAAAEMPVDDEGMTTEERALFDDLVDRIKQNKHTVLDILSGHGDSGTTSETESGAITTPQNPTTAADSATTARESAQDSPRESASQSASTESSDSMLANAMGSTTESTTETDHQSEPPVESTEATEMAASDAMAVSTDTDGSQPSAKSVATDVPPPTPGPESESEPDAVVESTATADSGETAADSDDTDRTMVRMTTDVGEIFCVDGREYNLQREDVVTLPTANADPLVDRDAARRVE